MSTPLALVTFDLYRLQRQFIPPTHILQRPNDTRQYVFHCIAFHEIIEVQVNSDEKFYDPVQSVPTKRQWLGRQLTDSLKSFNQLAKSISPKCSISKPKQSGPERFGPFHSHTLRTPETNLPAPKS